MTTAIASALCGALLCAAAPPVKVTVANVTHKASFAPYADNSNRMAGPRAPRGDARNATVKVFDITFPVVALNNGLVEVKVVPTLGMRIWNAVDLKTNTSLAGTADPRYWEKAVIQGNCGWTAGYVEPSFPSYEHGMFVLDQPAGWRVIRRGDGSATVAMNMRFTRHQHARDLARYGRYGDRALSGWVTLRPGESRYSVTYRVDNPNPLRRSNRLWVNFILHADGYDAEHILYPVGWHTGHAAWGFAAVHGAGGTPTFQGVSMFAVHPDYDFAGVYSQARDVNCLLVKDRTAQGLKLYTPGGRGGGVMEIWTGTNEVFEHSGWFLDPYLPTRQTITCYNVSGIGRVTYANRDVAFAASVKEGFKLLCPAAGKVEVTDGGQRVLAAGLAGPGKVLEGSFSDRMWVKIDGRLVADVSMPVLCTPPTGKKAGASPAADGPPPLAYGDVKEIYEEKVKPLGGPCRPELEVIAGNHGTPSPQDDLRLAGQIVRGGPRAVVAANARGRDEARPSTARGSNEAGSARPFAVDADRALSAANCCYRLGHLDLAGKLCDLIGRRPETDYLRGLIAWERGQKVDFAAAGLDSNYHRAMLAIQNGNKDKAVELLKQLVAARPKVYRPRLMLAYLTKDAALASALADENPGSPEAQLVGELLGVAGAKEAKDSLLQNNPSAAEQVEAFRAELTAGKWQHMPRFKLLAP